MIFDREVKILLRKELRQLFANRGTIATSAILPLLLLGVLPSTSLFLADLDPASGQDEISPGMRFGMLAEIGDDPRRLPVLMLPLFVGMVGIIVPTMLASHLLISERERRTLELLVALPVRIEQVLIAKFAAVIFATSAITVPLVALDAVLLPALGAGTFTDVAALPVLLVCALALSTSAALLTSLLSRDFRTANNISGIVLTPCIFITFAGSAVLPGGIIRPLVLAAAYLAVALVMLQVARKTITFERLLS